jgi:hypothetical protein
MSIRVSYNRLKEDINTSTSTVHTTAFTDIMKKIGSTREAMHELIDYVDAFPTSARTIDACLFRFRTRDETVYVVPGEIVTRADITYVAPGVHVPSLDIPGSIAVNIDRDVRLLTRSYGRNGFDAFRRGLQFTYEGRIISVGQLHVYWFIRQYDLVRYIVEKSSTLQPVAARSRKRSSSGEDNERLYKR